MTGSAICCKGMLPMNHPSCGILLHLTSLPSSYGIGTLGQAAYDFVDFLRDAGQSLSLIHI